MPTHVEAHRQHGIPRFQHGGVHGEVGSGPGMRLHVGVCGAEEFLGPLDRNGFDFVIEATAAVVPFSWVSFGVFIGENRTLGFEHRAADKVFTRDELEAFFLTVVLPFHEGIHFGVGLFDVVEGICVVAHDATSTLVMAWCTSKRLQAGQLSTT